MRQERIIKQNQDTFRDTLERLKNCLKELKLSDNERALAKLAIGDWETKLEDTKWWESLIRVENFRTILGFKRELSPKLPFSDLMDKVIQNSAEVDCAVHLVREFPDTRIEKLLKQNKKRICDFKIHSFVPHFAEVKTTSRFSAKKIEDGTRDALEQIKYSEGEGKLFGIVWIFTYDQPSNPRQAQDIVMSIKHSMSTPFEYKLNVQVYSRGLYGDATAKFI